MTQEVKVKVVTDIIPDMLIEITRNLNELPVKFYVAYTQEIQRLGSQYPPFDRNPFAAYRYASEEDYRARKQPLPVTLGDNLAANGFSPEISGWVLCFTLQAPPG
jgi:hypothetical protein